MEKNSTVTVKNYSGPVNKTFYKVEDLNRVTKEHHNKQEHRYIKTI